MKKTIHILLIILLTLPIFARISISEIQRFSALPFTLESSRNKPNQSYYKKYQDNNKDEIEILINGSENATIEQGSDYQITINFAENYNQAIIQLWFDINNNNIWEEDIDINMNENLQIADNNGLDENTAPGIYEQTIYAEETGQNNVADIQMIIVANDEESQDEAYLAIESIDTEYSISGHITPETGNIAIMAVSVENTNQQYIALTDDSGYYQSYLPAAGTYHIISFDPMQFLTDMLAGNYYLNETINGHETGFDFTFIEANCWLEGEIVDEDGTPIPGVKVAAASEFMPFIEELTDENGNYSIGLLAGTWIVDINTNSIFPDYLAPFDTQIEISVNETFEKNFQLYHCDSSIQGTVFLDDTPISGIEIGATTDDGWTDVLSYSNGTYLLPVASEADESGGYSVNIWEHPENTYVDNSYPNITSGANNIDFYLYTTSASINGYVYDNESGETLDYGNVNAINLETNQNYYANINENGYFSLSVINCEYSLHAHADNYYDYNQEYLNVQNEDIELDIYMESVQYNGSIYGFITDSENQNSISEAEITIFGQNFSTFTTTNSMGYYETDLPNGNFNISIVHPDYYNTNQNFSISNNELEMNLSMTSINFDSSIYGYVYDNETLTGIPFAGLNINNNNGSYFQQFSTDETGFYDIELPNGIFTISISAYNYETQVLNNIELLDEEYNLDIWLQPLTNVNENSLASSTILKQNYPNPFNPQTTISFSLPKKAIIGLKIYNIKGQCVSTLVNNELLEGNQDIIWSGINDYGKKVSSGLYFYQLRIDNKIIKTRKCLLMK